MAMCGLPRGGRRRKALLGVSPCCVIVAAGVAIANATSTNAGSNSVQPPGRPFAPGSEHRRQRDDEDSDERLASRAASAAARVIVHDEESVVLARRPDVSRRCAAILREARLRR